MSQDFAAGASAARNKLGSFLREHGFKVQTSNYGSPPTDEDFLNAVLALVGENRAIQEMAVVIFHWSRSTYELLIPRRTLESLTHLEARYYLFSATTDDKYRPDRYQHNFY